MRRPLGLALVALTAFAQKSGEQSEAVFRVTSTLVQVDAVVTDGKGRYVKDLTAADFVVLEDGKPQPITNFAYVQTGERVARESRRAAVGASAPNVNIPAAALKREEVRRTIVLMVDDLGLSFESMAYVRRALRKFVEEQVQPGDLVAVCRTGAGSGALQQFTNDKRILLAIISALRWNPNGRYGVGIFEPIGQGPDLDLIADPQGGPSRQTISRMLDAVRVAQNVREERSAMYSLGTIGAVNFMMGALREMPGRKSIVLFSDGLTVFSPDVDYPRMHRGGEGQGTVWDRNPAVADAMRRLIDTAARAGTVIYSVHAAGLQTLQFDASDRLGQTQIANAESIRSDRKLAFFAGQQGLAYLSEETGGLSFENGNDMNFALDKVLEDQSGYYLIGYRPSDQTFAETKEGYRSFHRIRVQVTRPGLKVRSRVGFFGATDDETKPKYETPLEQLRAAMLSPFRSSDVHLRLTSLYYNDAKQGPIVRNLVHIDTRDIKFDVAEDGTPRANVDIIAVASGPDDRPVAREARSYVLEAKAGRMHEALEQGAIYELDIPVKKGGPYRVQVAVRDAMSEKIGSASQFLDVPELKKSRLALSSIVLDDAARPPGSPDYDGTVAVKRQFRPGAQVQYGCLIAKGRKGKADESVQAEVRVFRDNRQIYSTPVKVFPSQGGGYALAGRFKLSDRMPPGDYYLQVVAADESKKNAVAEQWTDFEVLPSL